MTTVETRLGMTMLNDAALNKSTAFSVAERERLNLRGLLPAVVCSQVTQLERVLANLRRKANDMERCILLCALQARNERLFYCLVLERIGEMRHVLDNWPDDDVRVIVVTDGERILSLGDLGANGMGIPIGILALYTACAGIPPHQCLPVMLDVGTNNVELREGPLYLGVTAYRAETPRHLEGFAQDADTVDFVQTLCHVKPQDLVGATGAPGSFTQEAVETMATLDERPVILALSNPTDAAECTAEQACHWSEGRAIFASGSPFEPVEVEGRCRTPGQANNVYVFPGTGCGAIAAEACYLPDDVFMAAARALTDSVNADFLSQGNLYPSLADIRNVSLAVADSVFDLGLGRGTRPASLAESVHEQVYNPWY